LEHILKILATKKINKNRIDIDSKEIGRFFEREKFEFSFVSDIV